MTNVNVSDVSKAVRDLILEDPDLSQTFGETNVERSGFVNTNAAAAPWAGVYKSSVVYAPRALGRHSASWKLSLGTQVLLQVYSSDAGESAEDELELYLQQFMRMLFDNHTLKGTVDMVLGASVEYRFSETENESAYFQMAMVTINSEVATG